MIIKIIIIVDTTEEFIVTLSGATKQMMFRANDIMLNKPNNSQNKNILCMEVSRTFV